jgi:hypothetical protein
MTIIFPSPEAVVVSTEPSTSTMPTFVVGAETTSDLVRIGIAHGRGLRGRSVSLLALLDLNGFPHEEILPVNGEPIPPHNTFQLTTIYGF